MQNFTISNEATAMLGKKDPLMRELIANTPKPQWHMAPTLFAGLVRIIGGQQISQAAWRSVWLKLEEQIGDMTPQAIIETGVDRLRETGLSGRKAEYIMEAAEQFLSASFVEAVSSTERAIRHDALLSLRGVGHWSVDMLDITYFAEPDVFSVGDLGLQRALAKLYGIGAVDEEAMQRAAERFSPYGTTAALYLWQSLEWPMAFQMEKVSEAEMEAFLASPVGPLHARVGKTGIARIDFTDRSMATPSEAITHPLLRLLAFELNAYFDGNLRRFTVPIDRSGGTSFQQQVWRAIIDIPYGETITYGALAQKIGRPTAYRAVANALGRNPLSIVAPCHRIIGADGKLTGFGGGLARKRFLLDLEKGE